MKGAIERRDLGAAEVRIIGEAKFIDGFIPFNSLSEDLGGFREQLAPSVFTRTLNAKTNVFALWSHDEREVLGSVASGTLTIENRSDGVHFSIRVSTSAQHRAETIARGDVRGVSFGFVMDNGGDTWTEDPDGYIRTLRSARLVEVSIGVPWAAYPSARADTRSKQGALECLEIELELLGVEK